MSLYLDKSLLVSLLLKEEASERTKAWLARQVAGDLVISDWVETELASALAIKVRMALMTAEEQGAVLSRFADLRRSFKVVEVERSAFRQAARLCDRYDLGLRSSDALHLAICSARGDTLCTLDQRLARAATAVGAPVIAV